MRARTRWILVIAAIAAGIAAVLLFPKIVEGPGFLGRRAAELEVRDDRTGTPASRPETTTRAIEGKAFVEPPDESAESRAAPDRDHDLHGKVVDPKDAPVPGAAIAVIRNEGRERDVLDLDDYYDERVVAEAKTDALGRFQVRVQRGVPFDLVVTSEGFPRTKVTGRYAGEYVVIRLARPAALKGVITRAKDGTPVAGAKLRGWRDGGEYAELLRGATNAEGAYEITGLEPGKIVLEVEPPVLCPPPWQNLNLVAGETVVCNLALKEGTTATGIVTDAATRQPIADAEVGQGWTFDCPVRTGPDGRYVLTGVSRDNSEIHVRAKGYGRNCKPLPDPMPETLEVDFALHSGRSLRGRVVTADRSPVAGVYVAAAASGQIDGVQQIDWPSARSAADGRFRIDDLRVDVRHALCLRKSGFGSALFDLPPSETASDVIDVGDVVIEKGGSVGGIVVDPKDKPLPGVRLVLSGTNADRFRLWSESEQKSKVLDHYFDDVLGRSDDLGRFRFTDLATGEYRIRRAGGYAPNEPKVAVSIRAGEALEGVRLVVPIQFSIKGRVVLPDGKPAPMCVIEAYREDADRKSLSRETSCLSTGNGEFELSRLEEGVYTVTAFLVNDEESDSKAARGELRGVRTGAEDARVVLPKSNAITGTVVDARGKGMKDRLVIASDLDSGRQVATARTAEDGAFSIGVPDGMTVRITVMTPKYDGKSIQYWDEPTADGGEVAAGAKNLVLTIPEPK